MRAFMPCRLRTTSTASRAGRWRGPEPEGPVARRLLRGEQEEQSSSVRGGVEQALRGLGRKTRAEVGEVEHHAGEGSTPEQLQRRPPSCLGPGRADDRGAAPDPHPARGAPADTAHPGHPRTPPAGARGAPRPPLARRDAGRPEAGLPHSSTTCPRGNPPAGRSASTAATPVRSTESSWRGAACNVRMRSRSRSSTAGSARPAPPCLVAALRPSLHARSVCGPLTTPPGKGRLDPSDVPGASAVSRRRAASPRPGCRSARRRQPCWNLTAGGSVAVASTRVMPPLASVQRWTLPSARVMSTARRRGSGTLSVERQRLGNGRPPGRCRPGLWW